ncbi:MAG: hypothetical protein KAQ75_10770, partial [Bacteroidales bacterium]|nr:hypothetical protein [Bacteroidales bacterium]
LVSEPVIAQVDLQNDDKIEREEKAPDVEHKDEIKIISQNKVVDKSEINKTILDQKVQVISVIKNETDKLEQNLEKLASLPVKIETKYSMLGFIAIKENKPEIYINPLPDLSLIYAYNDIIEVEKNNKNDKWVLGAEFTPLYSYRYLSQSGSSEANNYNQVENAIMSYTGGLNLQFKAKDRLTVQAGVYYLTMGQSLDYMTVYANQAYDLVSEKFKDRYIQSYEVNNSVGVISLNTQYVIVDELASRVNNSSNSKDLLNLDNPIFQDLEAEIQQNFKYIEVPFILRFKLIDRHADVNLIGGIGANFLIGNDVYLLYGGKKEIIGETNNVNNVNYSTTLGFGIEYPLMKKINIRIEPTVKYYLNEINSNSSFESHPYAFGVYTGISYSF